MNPLMHQDAVDTSWFQLLIMDQLANIGREFSRALRAKENNKESRFNNAIARMIELLNLCLSDKRWAFYQKREVARQNSKTS